MFKLWNRVFIKLRNRKIAKIKAKQQKEFKDAMNQA